MNPIDQLKALPTSDQAVTTYAAMEAEIRHSITAASPATTWAPRRERRQSGCSAPFDNLGGRTVIIPSYGAEQPIADEDWQAVRTATEAIAQRYGLTTTTEAADSPGNHQVRYSSTADGAYVDIGSGKAAFVTTNTGCHLPE